MRSLWFKFLLGFLVLGGAGAYYLYSSPELLLKIAVAGIRGEADLSDKQTTINGHTIFYNSGGNKTGEAVVMIHGFAADKDNWTRMAKFFKDDFFMVAPDLGGHGESTRDDATKYTLPFQVDIVNKLTVELGLKSFHLIGNSMGGAISGHYAHKYPAKVKSIVFMNSGGVVSPVKSEHHQNIAKGVNKLLVNNVADFDRLMGFVFVKPPEIPEILKAYFAERSVKFRSFNDKIYKDAFVDNPVDLEVKLPEIKAPSLVLWGDTDRVIDVSAAGVFQQKLPNSKLVVMKKCGHAPMIERPEETADHIIKFYSSLQ